MTKAAFIILTLAGFASGAEMEVTDRLSVDGSSLFKSTAVFSGSVGIGTTNPSGILHVSTGTGTANLFVNSTSGNVGIGTTDVANEKLVINGGILYRYGSETGNTGWRIIRASDGRLNFCEAGVADDRLTLKPGGNVGIGTTNPLTKFHVENTAAANDVMTTPVLVRAGADAALGPLAFQVNFNPSATAGNRYISLTAGDNTGYRNLVLNPSGGNVGIGTTVPGVKLHVVGDIDSDSTLLVPTFTHLGMHSGWTSGFIGASNDRTVYLGRNGAADVTIQVGTGNVGIGTTSPGNKLDVIGNISASVEIYRQGVALVPGSVNGNLWAIATGGIQYSGGNVGIGTTGPSSLLHLNASIANSGLGTLRLTRPDTTKENLIRFDDAGTATWYVGTDDSTGQSTGFQIINGADASARMIITTAGNVGIGTTGPGELLEVNGTQPYVRVNSPVATGSFLGFSLYVNETPKSYYYYGDTAGRGDWVHLEASPSVAGGISFDTNGYNPRMVITQAGTVGIGTTSPGQALEVNGGIRANTTASQPSCDATTRGTFWVIQGAPGVKDNVQVCAKDASNGYAWRMIY